MDEFKNKIFYFITAISDLYKDEEERELNVIPKLDLKEETLTEDFTAMIFALHMLYLKITGDDIDIIQFTHIANRLVVQHILEAKEPGEKVCED